MSLEEKKVIYFLNRDPKLEKIVCETIIICWMRPVPSHPQTCLDLGEFGLF